VAEIFFKKNMKFLLKIKYLKFKKNIYVLNSFEFDLSVLQNLLSKAMRPQLLLIKNNTSIIKNMTTAPIIETAMITPLFIL